MESLAVRLADFPDLSAAVEAAKASYPPVRVERVAGAGGDPDGALAVERASVDYSPRELASIGRWRRSVA
jgi:hypothetical protein